VQQEKAKRTASAPAAQRLDFRIGVNLGDIIVEGEDIHGDGVNIADRIQALAEPGGVAISGTAYDQVKAKLPVGYASLGEQKVKSIAEPVRVYRVLMDPAAAGRTVAAGPPALVAIPNSRGCGNPRRGACRRGVVAAVAADDGCL
jgi:adenylate cyclase